jgi:nucleotide-binding universal stress UspA family protein
MTILCGTDFSEDAAHAVAVAGRLALRTSRPLVLVNGLEVLPHHSHDDSLRTAETQLAAEAARLEKQGVSVTTRVIRAAEPADALLECATQLSAAWIVVGARGRSHTGKSRVGRNADKLAAESHVPVLVVRDPQAFLAWTESAQPRPLNVLLGADASNTTAAALRFLEALREVGPCSVNALHLFWPPEQFQRLGFGGVRSFLNIDPEVRRAIGDGLVERFGSVPVEVAPHLGALGDGLVQAAARTRADLIVVGTHARTTLERIKEGSVSHSVLHTSELSVACVPVPAAQSAEVRPLQTALVATDFSEVGNAAIPLAYSVIGQGGTVHVVHVVPPTDADRFEPHDIFALEQSSKPSPLRDSTHDQLRKLVPQVTPANKRNTVLHVLQSHNPAQAIAQAAERLHADVITLGTHGRSGIARAMLGSIAQDVLEQTKRPVLLARVQR